MDYEKLVFETRILVQTARENAALEVIVMVCAVALVALAMVYVCERWSWVPRKRRDRIFVEKF